MGKIIVTGASGQFGHAAASQLLDAGEQVIALTRSPDKLADLAARGAEVRAADMGPGLGQFGEAVRRAAEEHEVVRRNPLQQLPRGRVAELPGHAGDDDLAQACSPVLGGNHNECYGCGNKREGI